MSKIQNADVKSLAQLQAAGATVAELINDTKIYVTANSINKQLSQAIIDGEIGAGSGGGVNFIAKGSADLATTSIFVPYKDAAATRPVDGTGGTSTVTTSVSSTTPLSGSKSFLLTKPASNTQGEGWAVPFTVDLAYRAKSVRIEFDYIVNSGTFVAGSQSTDSDVIWYIYDVTNSQLIEPSNIKMLANSTSLADKFQATFQTSATGSSYRLIAHCATTSALAYELKVDNIQVGPQQYVYGTPVTDWQSFTPTGSWTGAVTYTGKWRRVGDSMEVMVDLTCTGNPTGSILTINMPSGFSIDYSKMPSNINYAIGSFYTEDAGLTAFPNNLVRLASTTAVDFLYAISPASGSNVPSAAGPVTTTAPFSYGAGDYIKARWSVPILGWSSSVQMSDSADTRVVAFSATNNGANTTASWTTLTSGFSTVLDTHSKFSAGSWSCPVSGIYRISAGFASNSTTVSTGVRILINGSSVKEGNSFGSSTVQATATCSHLVQLTSDQTVSMAVYSSASSTTSGNFTYLTIERLSGPSAIAASETVAMRAAGTPTGTLAASFNKITWPTVQLDTHGGYSSGTYTVSSPGLYEVSAQVSITGGTITAGNPCSIQLRKSGSAFSTNLIRAAVSTGNGTAPVAATGFVRCVAGDTIEAYSYTAYGTPSYASLLDASEFYFQVRRVGN